MKIFLPLLCLCVFLSCVVAIVPNAHAQLPRATLEAALEERVVKRQTRYKFMYEKWMLKAREYVKLPVGQYPFFTLLDAYTKGPYYDPFGKETIDRLYELAYQAETTEDADKAQEAAISFQNLLHNHMANLDVVRAAIPLVRQNSYLSDIELLEWMQRGLQQRVLNSGNGAVLYNAYAIYTSGEEMEVLRSRNVKLVNTEVLSNGLAYYHVHLVEDARTGRADKIYMNLSAIVQHITEINRLKDLDYTYPIPVPEDFTGE